MKQMRSRFRLLTLLLACAFFLTFILCAGSVLKVTGINLSSLSALRLFSESASPDPAVPSDRPDPEASSPAPSDTYPAENVTPGNDISPDSLYNIFGL